MLNDVLATIENRRHQTVDLLKEFLRIPSVSANPLHKDDCRRCAQWVADQLRFAALDVAVMETGGHPCVVAKNKHIPGRPTVLVYGHYDVQPPDPMDLWKSPPFEPVIGKTSAGTDAVFARGAVDDKGQFTCHLEAITAWQAHGGVPVNLTVLVEGEEEIGSANLENFVRQHKEALRADVCVISDTNQFARGYPAITTGTRGLVYMELIARGPNRDLHSGLFGGAAPNPANVLVEMLASLHDANGRVMVPGFYDDVVELTPDERASWKKLPFSEDDFKRDLGVTSTIGENGFTSLEQTWARPTCDINGLTAGYQGPGAKTVIGSQASAKVSFRLVANQDPKKVRDAFVKMMTDKAPAGVTLEILDHGIAPAYLVSADHPMMPAARRAVETGFGKPATLIRSGGSIPIVSTFKHELGTDVLFLGFGLPDDNIHSPNEKFDLDCLYNGCKTIAALFAELSEAE
jgi:acetylornithine deacetylase/succinyl-diaminopimelate desuccinylase-like protein